MTFGALAFLNPWLLAALASLPVIYWLLRAVPPSPARVEFPPTRILVGLENQEKTAEKTPWWLTLIRLLAAAFVIFALAEPVLNPTKGAALKGEGPLVIVADNGWGAASRWPARARMIDRLISEAESKSRPVMLVATALKAKGSTPKIEPPADARTSAAAIEPMPFAPERAHAVATIRNALADANATGASIVWLHDGIDHAGDAAEIAQQMADIAQSGSFAVIDETKGKEALALAAQLGQKGKLEAVVDSPSGTARSGPIHAFSARGERLGEANFTLRAGERRTVVPFELPLELRNQVARIEIPGERSAGAVSLIDAATQWHRVGLISGASQEQAQPLLAPLYYIQKALQPFAELVEAKDANLAAGIDSILKQNISVLMLADIGTLPEESAKQVDAFVKKGGVLVRFAGPRLEKGGDDLLPVPLRAGGRSLGGALSWSTPQKLANFDDASPFSGLIPPADVLINRQVLADPAKLGPDVDIWARLADGTPLVTSTRRGEGRLVLFHTTANTDWSNLPISGLFVDMLRRISTMGRAASGAAADTAGEGGAQATSADAMNVLPPLKTLDGYGDLKPPPPTAEPIKASEIEKTVPSLEHPPGYYGNSSAPHSFNVVTPKTELKPIAALPRGVQRLTYDNAASVPLKSWMLALALALLFADIVAVLTLQAGGLKYIFQRRAASSAAALAFMIAGAACVIAPAPVTAQDIDAQSLNTQNRHAQNRGVQSRDDEFAPATVTGPPLSPADQAAIEATSKVTFGYVLSGDSQADEISREGLSGLGKVLVTRTAVDPGPPQAVDIAKDEIAFYPILYWPVLENAQPLPDAVIGKIDAYMKEGGLIIFDTRDYGQGGVNALPIGGKTGNALQRLLGKLDVPRLEPVPENHVVTKSFYLLHSFPGRWDGGNLWVEAINHDNGERQARVADGVTSIMITSNDFAAAWALDDRGRPIYPVVPGGENQREMSFRAGVNIVMHALTGNYKSDQVHVPAMLERLGQ
ncbi:MAG TPA: DUF4159 domain-containing protein [Hyphomicrobium sp.]|nr:DUF4159 domain-containing protein [Hyphomicrobium sp.]